MQHWKVKASANFIIAFRVSIGETFLTSCQSRKCQEIRKRTKKYIFRRVNEEEIVFFATCDFVSIALHTRVTDRNKKTDQCFHPLSNPKLKKKDFWYALKSLWGNTVGVCRVCKQTEATDTFCHEFFLYKIRANMNNAWMITIKLSAASTKIFFYFLFLKWFIS